MVNSDFSKLLNFLSEPRSMGEIIHHLGVSSRLARDYVEKAMEQDKVVIYRLIGISDKKSKGQKLHESSLYISRTSDLLSQGLTEFEVNTVRIIEEKKGKAFPRIKSTSTTKRPEFYKMIERGLSHEKITSNPTSASFPKLDTHESKLVKKTNVERLLVRRYYSNDKTKIPTPSEEISLLTALSLQPLSFMDLHSQFKTSKSTVKTLIKNGLIQEVWGPKDIGVKYKLASKGKSHLRKLKTATKLEIDEIGKARIQLKHKII